FAMTDQTLYADARKRNGYKPLFAASFAFCRAPASAPAIRICSTVIVPEVGAELVWRSGRGCRLEAVKTVGGWTLGSFAAFVSLGRRSGIICTTVPSGTCS